MRQSMQLLRSMIIFRRQRIVKIVDQSKESTPYAIPMVKGDDNASLKKAVNKALKELKEDGTLSKISIKYFGEDLTKE